MTATVFAKALVFPPWVERCNKVEREYYQLHLLPQIGEDIARVDYEVVTLHLGHDLRYTPDFRVIRMTGAEEFHEVKGPHIREDAMVKLRAAAASHPYVFYLAQRLADGHWKVSQQK